MKHFLPMLIVLASTSSWARTLLPTIDYREATTTDVKELQQLFQTKLGTSIPYNLILDEDIELKGMRYTQHTCYETIEENVQSEVEGCSIGIWSDDKGNLIRSRFAYDSEELPEEPEQAGLSSMGSQYKLAPHYLHLVASSQTDLSLKYDEIVTYKGQPAARFTWEDEKEKGFLYLSIRSFRIIDIRGKSKIKTHAVDLYPIYEQTQAWDPKTEESYLASGSTVPTELSEVDEEVKYSLAPIFSEGLGHHPWEPSPDDDLPVSTEEIKAKFAEIVEGLSPQANGKSGWLLKGKYSVVLVDHSAISKVTAPVYAPYVQESFKHQGDLFSASIFAQPILDFSQLDKPASNNPTTSVTDNHDALHAFHGTEHFFSRLVDFGYTDFSAEDLFIKVYLYNQDPSYKNNAYYFDSTINFTTYSDDFPNYARSNRVIWHELGHSVFDKLVNAYNADDSGDGVNEGISDFISHLLARDNGIELDYPGYRDLRIFSAMGFGYANESHDDGMAFGGTLKDVLEVLIEKEGKDGIRKMADLLLATLRLVRNHPNLNEYEFFETMIFADELGGENRQKGEIGGILRDALTKRNYNLNENLVNSLKVSVTGLSPEETVIEQSGEGSGSWDIEVPEAEKGNVSGKVKFTFEPKDGKTYGPLVLSFVVNNKDSAPVKWITKTQKISINPNESVEIPYEFSKKCRTYSRGSMCPGAMVLSLREKDAEWSFAKRTIFFKIAKPEAETE